MHRSLYTRAGLFTDHTNRGPLQHTILLLTCVCATVVRVEPHVAGREHSWEVVAAWRYHEARAFTRLVPVAAHCVQAYKWVEGGTGGVRGCGWLAPVAARVLPSAAAWAAWQSSIHLCLGLAQLGSEVHLRQHAMMTVSGRRGRDSWPAPPRLSHPSHAFFPYRRSLEVGRGKSRIDQLHGIQAGAAGALGTCRLP